MSSDQSLPAPHHGGPMLQSQHAGTDALVSHALRYGAVGALVGGMTALPAAYDATRSGSATLEQATHRVLRAGAQAAVATSVGALAASIVGHNQFLRLTAMLLAGGATLHALSSRSTTPPDAPAS